MSENITEKRAHARQRVLKGGRLAFHSGGSVDCIVRNLSAVGARIEVASPIGLPESFTLLIDADNFTRCCHPVWRRDTRIGIAFD